MPHADYTIISYVDSAGCMSCKLQLPKWKSFISEMVSASQDSIAVIFIFHPKDIEEIAYRLKLDRYDYPVCIDIEDEFNKLNYFPDDIALQTFLLNRNQEILAIGNPAYGFQMTTEWRKEIDGLYERYPYLLYASEDAEDLAVLDSAYLVGEIDRSFRAWQENTYTSGCSFETFCEYILPYRRMNGLVADHARDTFYHRHAGRYYAAAGKHWREETVSLLHEYKDLTHSNLWGSRIPVWDAGTFERLRHQERKFRLPAEHSGKNPHSIEKKPSPEKV